MSRPLKTQGKLNETHFKLMRAHTMYMNVKAFNLSSSDSEPHNVQALMCNLLGEKGDWYHRKGQLEQAHHTLLKALQISRSLGTVTWQGRHSQSFDGPTSVQI